MARLLKPRDFCSRGLVLLCLASLLPGCGISTPKYANAVATAIPIPPLPGDAHEEISNHPTFPDDIWWLGTRGKADIQFPQMTYERLPPYPPLMLVHGKRGEAEMVFVIEKDGAVSAVQVVYATNRYFARSASESVVRSSYQPGRYKGEPVKMSVSRRFIFVPHEADLSPELAPSTR